MELSFVITVLRLQNQKKNQTDSCEMHPNQTGVVMPFLAFKEAQLFWLIFLFQEMIIFNLAKSNNLVTSHILV